MNVKVGIYRKVYEKRNRVSITDSVLVNCIGLVNILCAFLPMYIDTDSLNEGNVVRRKDPHQCTGLYIGGVACLIFVAMAFLGSYIFLLHHFYTTTALSFMKWHGIL